MQNHYKSTRKTQTSKLQQYICIKKDHNFIYGLFFETKNLLFILNITPLQVRFHRVHKPRRTLLK